MTDFLVIIFIWMITEMNQVRHLIPYNPLLSLLNVLLEKSYMIENFL